MNESTGEEVKFKGQARVYLGWSPFPVIVANEGL